jgi:hypothetical protein
MIADHGPLRQALKVLTVDRAADVLGIELRGSADCVISAGYWGLTAKCDEDLVTVRSDFS